MREIEIKLKVGDLDKLEKDLIDNGCIFSGPISQHDRIYLSPDGYSKSGDAKEGHIAIRIRQENGKAILNLKKQKSNEMDNMEYETEVKSPGEVDKMLKALGWNSEVDVKKIRKMGKLEEFTVCLDQVEKLGNYLELEKMADDNADPAKVREELFEALKPFGLSEKDEETKGYDTLIHNLEKYVK